MLGERGQPSSPRHQGFASPLDGRQQCRPPMATSVNLDDHHARLFWSVAELSIRIELLQARPTEPATNPAGSGCWSGCLSGCPPRVGRSGDDAGMAVALWRCLTWSSPIAGQIGAERKSELRSPRRLHLTRVATDVWASSAERSGRSGSGRAWLLGCRRPQVFGRGYRPCCRVGAGASVRVLPARAGGVSGLSGNTPSGTPMPDPVRGRSVREGGFGDGRRCRDAGGDAGERVGAVSATRAGDG